MYEGLCPNFFIPQNNMFLTKIHGSAQVDLFKKLHGFYEENITFLKISPTIRRVIDVTVFSNFKINILDVTEISKNEFDAMLLAEIDSNEILFSNLQIFAKAIQTVKQLIYSTLTEYQIILVQKNTVSILRSAAFILLNIDKNTNANKLSYISDKKSRNMLKLVVKFGFLSDIVYIAMYYYKTNRYKEA